MIVEAKPPQPNPIEKPPHIPHIKAIHQSRLAIFARDGFTCQYCGVYLLRDITTFYSATVDHVWPKSRGGEKKPENLVSCCAGCNELKSSFPAKSVEEARGYVAGQRAQFSSYLLKLLEFNAIDLPPHHDGRSSFQRDVLHALASFSGQAAQITRRMKELDDWARSIVALLTLSTERGSPVDPEPVPTISVADPAEDDALDLGAIMEATKRVVEGRKPRPRKAEVDTPEWLADAPRHPTLACDLAPEEDARRLEVQTANVREIKSGKLKQVEPHHQMKRPSHRCPSCNGLVNTEHCIRCALERQTATAGA